MLRPLLLAIGLFVLCTAVIFADGSAAAPATAAASAAARSFMDAPFYEGFVVLTGWKMIGYVGTLLFVARWPVQALHRHRTGSAEMPTLFWIMSLCGAALTLLYFTFGKNDSVGILQTALPVLFSGYNLIQDLRARWSGKPRMAGKPA